MKKYKSKNRIEISAKRASGKSLNIVHNKRISKLDKDLLSKIDNILIEYKLNNDLIPTFPTKLMNSNTNNTNNSKLQKNEEQKIEKSRRPSAGAGIKMPKSSQNLDFDQNMPNIDISLQDNKKKKLPKIKKKKKLSNNMKGGFLTGVGLIKEKKDNNRQNRFLEQNNEEINKLLNNIDEIDKFVKNPEKDDDAHLFEGSPGYRDRMEKNRRDFEELIKEIDGYKKEMQDEFDEIQYLIKFTNNTEKLIDRHKNVINGIFKGAGLSKQNISDKLGKDEEKNNRKNKSQNKNRIKGYLEVVNEVDKMDKEMENEEDYNDIDDEYLLTSVSELSGVFYKLKKINQIKDNLTNIQDDCLGYHEKLKNTLKRSESAKPPIKTEEKKI